MVGFAEIETNKLCNCFSHRSELRLKRTFSKGAGIIVSGLEKSGWEEG